MRPERPVYPVLIYNGRPVELMRDHAAGARTNGRKVDRAVIREADGRIRTVRRDLLETPDAGAQRPSPGRSNYRPDRNW